MRSALAMGSSPADTARAVEPGREWPAGLGFAAALALALVSLLGGCATVQPYERETLSRPCMKPDPDPLGRNVEVHVQENREGAVGGTGVSGGGCGCN